VLGSLLVIVPRKEDDGRNQVLLMACLVYPPFMMWVRVCYKCGRYVNRWTGNWVAKRQVCLVVVTGEYECIW
jgi:hypothetical protein